MITAGLVQDYPNRFDAALPMCGVLSGGVATWNTSLDAAFAFAKLIDPSVQVTGITNPTANLANAEAAVAQAQQTAAAGPSWPWSRRSGIPRAGSRRCPPSPPPPTSRRRKPTSICGSPR